MPFFKSKVFPSNKVFTLIKIIWRLISKIQRHLTLIFRWQYFDSGLFVYETFSSENFLSEFFTSLSRFRLRFLCLQLLCDILVDNFGTFCDLSL